MALAETVQEAQCAVLWEWSGHPVQSRGVCLQRRSGQRAQQRRLRHLPVYSQMQRTEHGHA